MYTFLFVFNIYLFLERWEGKRKGEKHQCARETWIGCLSHTPNWGPGQQPRDVPWLGIEPATPWFTGHHSIHWATPARAQVQEFNLSKLGFSSWEVKHVPSLPLFSGVALGGLTLEPEIHQNLSPWWILNSGFCTLSFSTRISKVLCISFFSQAWNWQVHLREKSTPMWGSFCHISFSWFLSPVSEAFK